MEEYERVREQAILKILEGSPITLHRRDEMDNVKAGKIFDQILTLDGIEIKSSDQSLPINEDMPCLPSPTYNRAQQDMLKAGFVKVIKKEEEH